MLNGLLSEFLERHALFKDGMVTPMINKVDSDDRPGSTSGHHLHSTQLLGRGHPSFCLRGLRGHSS